MAIQYSSDASFKADVLDAEKLTMVDFWAEWCGPCRAIAPVLEELDQEYGEKVQIIKLNIDEHPETPSQFGVRSIPTLMLFKGGEMVSTKVGAVAKNTLMTWIDENL